jgi:hypothetical protein
VRKHALDGTSTPGEGDGDAEPDGEAEEADGDRNNDDQSMHDDSASNDVDTIPKRKRFRQIHTQYSDDSSTENSMCENSLADCLPHAPVDYDIELVFKPHPMDPDFEGRNVSRYIKTTGNATGVYVVRMHVKCRAIKIKFVICNSFFFFNGKSCFFLELFLLKAATAASRANNRLKSKFTIWDQPITIYWQPGARQFVVC